MQRDESCRWIVGLITPLRPFQYGTVADVSARMKQNDMLTSCNLLRCYLGWVSVSSRSFDSIDSVNRTRVNRLSLELHFHLFLQDYILELFAVGHFNI
jgi:hypothetical protein